MAGSEAAEATGDVLGIKSLLLARGVVAGKNDKTAVLPATMHGYLGKGYRKTCHSSMTSAIPTMPGSEAAEATADVLGIKSLVLDRGVVAGKKDKTVVLP